MSKPIRILIADDHDIVIDGLKTILNPFSAQKEPNSLLPGRSSEQHPFQIVGIAVNGTGLLERLAQLPETDVVVLDYYKFKVMHLRAFIAQMLSPFGTL
jgi:DNA-binding NarL/FixJ family response regulator